MAIRDEVRILKSNTLEEFRQKSNELSIRNVGDDNLIHTNIADKKESFTATAGQKFFELSGRFEVLPEQTIDKTKVKDVVQSLVQMLDEASQIVDFFKKWDEQKTVKKKIKHTILKHYDLSLVKPVTDRFMELAQVKFK